MNLTDAARILGRVFARQEVLFRRDRYTAFMPRTWHPKRAHKNSTQI